MKLVIIGGTGLIGSKLVTTLREHGHEAVAASPQTGVNTLRGEGLADVLEGASVVVDVSNSPSFEEAVAMHFFTTSTQNLLSYAASAGVKHHVALSVVGIERLPGYAYFRAKMAQEALIEDPRSRIDCSRDADFEFVTSIAASATDGKIVRLPPVLIQPMAADDVAKAVGKIAVGAPVNGIVEIAGPETFRLDELIRQGLSAPGSREVVADPQASYFGGVPSERTLVPGDRARLGEIRFQEWLCQPMSVAAAPPADGHERPGASRTCQRSLPELS